MSVISMKQLLEAGVHFGHQTRRWNPKMAPYIYTERNGIHIIDLQKSVGMVDDAYNAVKDCVAQGGKILFVGTKKQAQDSIQAEAERCGMFYVNQRWLGGMMTNFKTIESRIARLKKIKEMEEDGTFDVLPKREVLELNKEKDKLQKNLGGIEEMGGLPDMIFVVDPKKESICVQEAHTLGIPLVGIAATNSDPVEFDYIIPGNDVAIRAVKELRERTGAGMMDCKKALTNTDGDMDAAVEFLRENGLAKAAKKAGRIAAEGLVAVAVSEDAKEAAIVEVNSETDFVAKNDTFRTYVAEVADQALTTKAADIEGFLAEESKAEAGKTVKEALDGKIAVIGENLNIRRFAKVSAADGFVASYIHAGGKIGVLVEVATDVVNDEIKEMAKNVAMQVAAISPKYTSRDEVSKDYIEHETEILKVQAMNENPDKPENIIEKMIVGRLNKELKEVCLLDQAYVKAEDGKQAVGKYVEQVAKANGANVTIKGFVRFETGEGIEKKEEDFAAEVAAQLK